MRPILYAMSCCIPGSINHCWESFRKDFTAEIKKIPSALGQADQVLDTALGVIAWGITPVVATLGSAFGKTATFVKNNWRQLVGYLLTWGVIISCTGLLYGFKAVALPLTIGLGFGAAFGLIAGLLSVNSFDPEGKYTLWNILNQGIEGLDQNGTKQIVLAVAVTVLLAASVVFPYVMGAVFGLFIALQVAVKIGSGQNLGHDPEKEENQRDVLQRGIEEMKTKLAQLESLANNLSPSSPGHPEL